MISAPVKNISGSDVGTYEFDPAELAPDINRQLLHDVVVMYEANRRVGTAKTKSRGMVKGSTKKLFRQKGTGRARMGARRTPIRRGGGHTFAKVPRDWGYRLPKKAVRLATRMALLSKFQDGEAVVLDSLDAVREALPAVEETGPDGQVVTRRVPRSRVIADILAALGLERDSCLLAIDEHDALIWRSARNIPTVWVRPCGDLNAYDLLHQKRLVVTREAMDRLRGRNGS